MKKSIRITALALGGVMTFGLLSGCGKTATTGNSELTTVTVWTVNSHSQQVITNLCNQWNEKTGKEKGIKIDYQVKGGDSLSQTLEIALQNGTAPDFFGSGDLKKLAEKGDILAIEDLPGSESLLAKYKDYLEEGRGMYEGKNYTLPISASTGGLIYNKEMFKAAGIVDEKGEAKPPETLEELREDAKKLTNADKKQYGIIFPLKWGGWYASDVMVSNMSSTGYEEYNPSSGKYEYEGFKKTFETFIGIKNDGSVYPGADGLDNDTARALFADGNIGMKYAFSFDVGVLNDQFPAKIEWGVAPYPAADKNVKYKQRMAYGDTCFINKKSKVDKAKLLEVLKFFTSDEYIIETYKQGVELPYNWDIVKDIKLENPKKGWKEFAEMVGISTLYSLTPELDLGGLRAAKVIFVEDVYTEKISIDDGIKLMNENMNKAVDNYYNAHTDKDREAVHNTNWEPKKR